MQERKTENLRIFAEVLKSLRERQGLSQADLAGILKVSTGTVGNWEARRNGPSNRQLKEISEKLSVSLDYLLTGVPGEAPNTSPRSAPTKAVVFEIREMREALMQQVRRLDHLEEMMTGDPVKPTVASPTVPPPSSAPDAASATAAKKIAEQVSRRSK